MIYITNKYGNIKFPNDPGLLEWLVDNYPFSQYHLVEQ